jgi:hypothetical protein
MSKIEDFRDWEHVDLCDELVRLQEILAGREERLQMRCAEVDRLTVERSAFLEALTEAARTIVTMRKFSPHPSRVMTVIPDHTEPVSYEKMCDWTIAKIRAVTLPR